MTDYELNELRKKAKELGKDLVDFMKEVDEYEFQDTVESKFEFLNECVTDILNENTDYIKNYINEFIEDSDDEDAVKFAKSLLKRMQDLEA